MHCSGRLIVQTLVFGRSYLHRRGTLLVKGGTTWARNGRWILPENARLPRNIHGSFTCRKSTTWDKRLYFPSEGRRTEDFFALKNPTAGFEPANLGTKGQHATSRPPKPHVNWYSPLFFNLNLLSLRLFMLRIFPMIFLVWHAIPVLAFFESYEIWFASFPIYVKVTHIFFPALLSSCSFEVSFVIY